VSHPDESFQEFGFREPEVTDTYTEGVLCNMGRWYSEDYLNLFKSLSVLQSRL